jgi:rhodanese-related sulfurtransferase
VALILKRRGITRVRPLLGGLDGWRAAGLPLAPFVVTAVVERPPE